MVNQLSNKAFYLNQRDKEILVLIFSQQLQNFWWSAEHLNGTSEGFIPAGNCGIENSKAEIGYNSYSSVNLEASSVPIDNQQKDSSFSNLHELRKPD